jgi:hypothetical protein
MQVIHGVDVLLRPAWQALWWSGLSVVLTGVMYSMMVLYPVRRGRWVFHRPSLCWRVVRGDIPLLPTLMVLFVWLIVAGGLSEWLRHGSPAWPGAALQTGVLRLTVVMLVNTVRHARCWCLVPAWMASLLMLRMIWIWLE